jgi:hypothetical protein
VRGEGKIGCNANKRGQSIAQKYAIPLYKKDNSRFVVYGVGGRESPGNHRYSSGSRQGRAGIGIDVQLNESFNAGVEISASAAPEIGNQHERLHSAYLSWAPSSDWTLGLGISYERLGHSAGENPRCSFGHCTADNPEIHADTVQVLQTTGYSSSSGPVAGISAIFVRNETELSPLSFVFSFINNPSDNIVLLDAGLGYRLSRNQGILSLEVLGTLENKEARLDTKPIFSAPHGQAIAIRFSLDF